MERSRVMLDLIGTVVLVAVIALCLYAFVTALPISRAGRLAIVTGAGAWTGLAAAFAAAGQFANTNAPPLIGVFVALPPLVTAVAAIGFPAVRAALLAIPLPTL